MPQTVTLNGSDYVLPTSGDVDYGSDFARWMRDITRHAEAGPSEGYVIDVTQAPYGAVGDGATDDTAAIQAAITAAAPGDTVFFPNPSSTYKITSPLSISGKSGLHFVFPKGSSSKIHITNTYAGAALDFHGSSYCRVSDASIQNTSTASGIGIHARGGSYELVIENCHVKDGFGAIVIGNTGGDIAFNVFVRGLKAESVSDSAVTLSYGVYIYGGVNLFFEYCYVHKVTSGYKRIVPAGGPTADGYYADNLKFFHCIAESCNSHAFDLDACYNLTLERPYIEGWGALDATPASYAIRLSGLTYAQAGASARKAVWRIVDPLFYGGGSQAGGGWCVSLLKFFHIARFEGGQSSIPRDKYVHIDDADAGSYTFPDGCPIVRFDSVPIYGTISKGNTQAIIIEDGTMTAGAGALNTLAPGTKADVGTGVARAGVVRTIVGPEKFAPDSWAIAGTVHYNLVVDTDSIGFNKWPTSNANNGFDDDRFFNVDTGTTNRGIVLNSDFWNSIFRQGFSNPSGFGSSVFLQAREKTTGNAKGMQLNPEGGHVSVGLGGYQSALVLFDTNGTPGKYYNWIDQTGGWRFRVGLPGSDTDGGLFQGQNIRAASATPVTVTSHDYCVLTGLSVPGAVAVNLPASPVLGQTVIIKDKTGDAGANNITINRAGGQVIDGLTTKVISTNYGSARLIYDGANWWSF